MSQHRIFAKVNPSSQTDCPSPDSSSATRTLSHDVTRTTRHNFTTVLTDQSRKSCHDVRSTTIPADVPVLNSRDPMPLWKRALDLTWCVAVSPAFLVIAAFVAVLIKTTSPGPIFFTQERVGYRGRRFQIFKFRTMHLHAERDSHAAHFQELVRSNSRMQKLDAAGDRRMIAGARWIRAAGLDELPQLINVVRGDMSAVGPRPCIPYEYDQYTAESRRRFETTPGLTGLWQVSGKNNTTFQEMVAMDIRYAERKNLALDLRIMLLTPVVLVGQILDVRRAKPAIKPQKSRIQLSTSNPFS
jgi:exopolysaccharide production protein ExoY